MNSKGNSYMAEPRRSRGRDDINVTRKMRIALFMISKDSQYVCKWQTIVRLTEAGYISYTDGRACITPMGRELLSHKPGLARAQSRDWTATKKYG